VRPPAALLCAFAFALAGEIARADDAAPGPSDDKAAASAAADAPVELSGTLAKASASGAVAIAYREASVPFSYLSPRGEPVGYSIALCRKLVEAMGSELEVETRRGWGTRFFFEVTLPVCAPMHDARGADRAAPPRTSRRRTSGGSSISGSLR